MISALKANDEAKLTTAIITKDLASAEKVAAALKEKGAKAHLISSANQRLVEGDLVLPSYLAKGLEFDAVIMWGASKAAYHELDETQLVYTIISRAMYKLDIIYSGEKSPLLTVKDGTYEAK